MGPIRSFMGLPIWKTRIHPSLGPYGNAIWVTHGSIIGVSICACPHWTHIGTIWACPYGLDCMGPNSYSSQTWPIWDLGPTWMNYAPHTGPIWACYLGPTWVLYGRSHMGVTVWDSYWSYMGVPIWVTRIHPTLGPYMIAIWATLGSIIGVSLCACPLGRMGPSHMGPILACYLGPIWVIYGLAHMGIPL